MIVESVVANKEGVTKNLRSNLNFRAVFHTILVETKPFIIPSNKEEDKYEEKS